MSKLLEQQLDSLIRQHGCRPVWAALSMVCVRNAEAFKDRKPHVKVIWSGWAAMFTGMWLQGRPLADYEYADDGISDDTLQDWIDYENARPFEEDDIWDENI
jgi:hypothetical protein